MSIAMGAWLAAVLGLVTGSVWASIRHPANRVWIIVAAVLGAALAELVYGACLAVGFVLSFMFVTGPPAAAPALLCVVIGSAASLLAAWLQSVLEPHTSRGGSGRPGR